ncbi:hypothetical protein KAH27_04435, partial [bacterium]|nr:hypothetical protein [bacterium]
WVNGNAQCDKSHSCTFTDLEKNIPLKAILTFKSENELEYGVNLLKVEFEDARGNKDQLYYYLLVSQNGSIKNLKNAPNPVYETTSFKFDFIASDNESQVTIEIHNLAGRKVRTVSGNCTIGENSIEWDGRDSDGRKLAVGAYFYMMTIQSNSYIEPVFGKLIIVD